MSDPVTNLDIEDVLSSIRRLVAEGDRAVAEPRIVAQPVANAPSLNLQDQAVKVAKAGQERFVLTPALRVAEREEVRPSADQPQAEAEPEMVWSEPTPEPAPIESNEAELQDEPTPELREEPTVTNWPSMPDNVAEAPEPLVEPAAAVEPVAAVEPAAAVEPDVEPFSEPEPFNENQALEDARARLEAKIAELEAVVGPEATQWPGSAPLVDIVEASDEPVGESVEAFEEFSVPEMVEDESAEVAEAEATDDAEWADIEAELPDVEPAEVTTPLAPEMPADDVGVDEDDIDWAADAEPSDEAVLDEEALRRIVSEIVREELQGALGERITRNVRKLVRREIYRAMAAESME